MDSIDIIRVDEDNIEKWAKLKLEFDKLAELNTRDQYTYELDDLMNQIADLEETESIWIGERSRINGMVVVGIETDLHEKEPFTEQLSNLVEHLEGDRLTKAIWELIE